MEEQQTQVALQRSHMKKQLADQRKRSTPANETLPKITINTHGSDSIDGSDVVSFRIYRSYVFLLFHKFSAVAEQAR